MAQSRSFEGSEAPTPPTGMPVIQPGADDATPAEGFTSLRDVINAEDIGSASPAVFGAPEPEPAPGEAGDWPKLEYRSRNRPERPGRTNPLRIFRRRAD
ncbi:hypothetical protein GCM10011581_10490 [Saccharopolyspora subtropica]|uniref:Uncharacterized protein n=1 Tax=Saccharopolyspora thermophila TaxID=89367 RepID=A0A917N7M7_9PSEU|nr:hypothetical protein [Saccharopolyspora subtropica]GGI75346.1 hypothetical protein GCM10011581_10490 [Saccharopolyspora subtropica]